MLQVKTKEIEHTVPQTEGVWNSTFVTTIEHTKFTLFNVIALHLTELRAQAPFHKNSDVHFPNLHVWVINVDKVELSQVVFRFTHPVAHSLHLALLARQHIHISIFCVSEQRLWLIAEYGFLVSSCLVPSYTLNIKLFFDLFLLEFLIKVAHEPMLDVDVCKYDRNGLGSLFQD